jgi:hypothetical protein
VVRRAFANLRFKPASVGHKISGNCLPRRNATEAEGFDHETSNADWKHPWDPAAKIAKMKAGRTHLAYKAEHAVDLETGALVAVTLQDADQGDTTTIIETVIAAAEQSADAQAAVRRPSRGRSSRTRAITASRL